MSSSYSFEESIPHHVEEMILIIGSFDGLHLGHYELFKRAYRYKSENPDFFIHVLTFSYPIEIFFTKNPVSSIFSLSERQLLFNQISADKVNFIEPKSDLFELTAKEFLTYLLKDNNKIHLILSEDSHFGKDKAGAKEISSLLKDFDGKLSLESVPIKLYNNEKISSSLIKKHIKEGRIEDANALFFHPYFIYGQIIKGNQRGREFGYPTMNIVFPEGKTMPPFGVYSSEVSIQEKYYQALTYIGNYKLDEKTNNIITETWVSNYIAPEGVEFYGLYTSINLIKFIRPPKKISSKEELIKLIEKDKLTLNQR